jgi:hypothetical protein
MSLCDKDVLKQLLSFYPMTNRDMAGIEAALRTVREAADNNFT